jgi:hypothetical protein
MICHGKSSFILNEWYNRIFSYFTFLTPKKFERGFDYMKQKDVFPSREELDEAFHYLHDQINKISVVEEMEMVKKEKDGLED